MHPLPSLYCQLTAAAPASWRDGPRAHRRPPAPVTLREASVERCSLHALTLLLHELLSNEQWAAAESVLRYVLAFRSHAPEVWQALGWCLEQQGRAAHACAVYGAAAQLHPAHVVEFSHCLQRALGR